MNEAEYLESRLEDQIKWYGKKSAANKMWYRRCQFTLLLLATLVTLSAAFQPEDFPWINMTTAILGALIALISGVLGLYKFQENWTAYRTTAESLKHEKYLYLTKSEPYNAENPFKLFVFRIENLISEENSKWMQYMNKEAENGTV